MGTCFETFKNKNITYSSTQLVRFNWKWKAPRYIIDLGRRYFHPWHTVKLVHPHALSLATTEWILACKCFHLKSIQDLVAFRDLDYSRQAVWRAFMAFFWLSSIKLLMRILKVKAVLPWSSRNVLWLRNFTWLSISMVGEQIITIYSFLDELPLQDWLLPPCRMGV